MDNVEKMKSWIDNASYKTLLVRWRHVPVGDPIFQGDIGDYYAKIMREKKEAIEHDAAVQASKNIGW